MKYEYLRPFTTTDRQREVLDCLSQGMTFKKTGETVGMAERNVYRMIQLTKKRAAQQNITGGEDVPPGYVLDGTSTLKDMETGEAKLQWIKTKKDKDQQIADLMEAVKDGIEDYAPIPKVKQPKHTKKDMLTIYPMGDPHIGMYAWAGETGEDFDCDIAERDLREAMKYLVEQTPPTETAIILNLGDFFHSDNTSNRTARAGNALDVDTRWSRVLQIGVTLMIDCVHLALEKHKRVIVKNNIGNHDTHTSQVLSVCMSHAFSKNNRVEIAEPASPFFMYEFGKNMIFSTHGDMVKPNKTQGLVSNYYPEAWGRTEHRYCYLGHFHHENRVEDNGLITEIFNTLASSDAWHHASGYRSKRNMKAIVLDKDLGEIERYTFSLKRCAL